MRSVAGKVKQTVSLMGYSLASVISPKLNTQLHFYRHTGHFANLKDPKTFSEKLSWLKLYRYAEDPLVRQCADKYRVRSYVQEQGLGEMLNELIAVYDDPRSIRWEELPSAFALKWNFGSGFNIICKEKAKLDPAQTVHRLVCWEKDPFWLHDSELQYRVPAKKLLCERYLGTPEGDAPLDYKFYCFHGEVKAVLVIARPEDGTKAAVFMSPQWEVLSDVPEKYKRTILPQKPATLQQMLAAAQRLAQPFPYVRVDFYECGGRPIFGEMTFTPATGVFPSETPIDGRPMGELLRLEDLPVRSDNGTDPQKECEREQGAVHSGS